MSSYHGRVAQFGGNEAALREYRNECLASYFAIGAQALMNFVDGINKLEPALTKLNSTMVQAAPLGDPKKGKGGIVTKGLSSGKLKAGENEVVVGFLGYDDAIVLAKSAFISAAKAGTKGIKSPNIRSLYNRIITDKQPMVFDGQTNTVTSGGFQMTVGGNPQLKSGGVSLYGSGFGGFSGAFKLSASWSYTSGLDQLKSVTAWQKFADDVSQYTDNSVTAGQGTDAIYSRGKALEAARASKSSASAGGLKSLWQ